MIFVSRAYGLPDSGECGRIADGKGREFNWQEAGRIEGDGFAKSDLPIERLADASIVGREWGRAGQTSDEPGTVERPERLCDVGTRPGPVNGHWRAADWLGCRDGKWRPVEPGTFPLAHGAAARVGRLRAYGNAINAEAARVFIECVMEAV